VSLAALLGIDARTLLTTDDAATHVVYDRVIDQAREWWLYRADLQRHNLAVDIVNTLGEAFGKK